MVRSSDLPNVHVSSHPCVKAKLSQLRSKQSDARQVKTLVHDISLILGVEVLGRCLETTKDSAVAGTAETPLGYTYTQTKTKPSVALIPILRSGLGMLEAVQQLLPESVPVHHLGLFREPTTLTPVEYYNNLPYHRPPPSTSEAGARSDVASPIPDLAIVLDPVIATGGTATAAIQTLQEWGVKRVILMGVLASEEGLVQAATESGTDRVEVYVAEVDDELDARGMIKPGLGDIGDRLFLTVGK